jgi:iron complex outermembrane receptor protein
MKKFILLFLFVFALPESSNAIEGNRDVVMLEEIVVTATKTEERRQDVPNSVITINEADIQESPAQSLGELLSNELGIDLRDQGDYGGSGEEIHIRGMSGNATQVFVNGINVNSPSLGIADVGKIPLNNIERIEVVKGSASLLYGSGAMGGTVNIITKNPKKGETDLQVNSGYGSQNTYYLSAAQGMFLNKNFGYYLSATRAETKGFRDNSDLTHNDVSLKLVLDKGDALDISFYGDYIDREFGVPGIKPPDGTQDYFVDGMKVYNNSVASLFNKGSDEDAHTALQLKGKPLDWLGYNFRGDYSNMENYNYLRYIDYFGDLPGSKSWTTNKVLGLEGNIDITVLKGTNFLLGTDYKDYDWENKSINLDAAGAEVSGTESIAQADLHTNGTFTEIQYRPCKYFKALAGMRHENHSTFGNEDLPRYGLIINPLEETTLKLSHGKHFRAPTPNDLFWPDDGFTKGNPDLRPEIGWHTDATVEQALFENKLFIVLSCFQWNIDDKIQWETDSNGIYSPENLRGYEATGYEAGVKIGPVHNMMLSLDYTYTDAEEESHAYTKQDYGSAPLYIPDFQYTWVKRRAAYTPRHQFKGNLTFWANSGLNAIATLRYVSDRLQYHTETDAAYPATKTVTYDLDSCWIADLELQKRFYENWLVFLQVNNLFDEEYYTYLDSFTDQSTGNTTVEKSPGAGRSVLMMLTYSY